ncbi:hypothetical protein FHX81_0218 [Saccharothrix saharensis]|uniref:Uncharacterized protein n=1 Tax=Saccharothrix saharensis TaxID=571190 RepID=A0A543J555_9PSEU|nr:hypothetical protein [Saccharothrix saharensis]TQM77970.1 hypothetical protein FHX81_0218 [Saccharothrix saharensis]
MTSHAHLAVERGDAEGAQAAIGTAFEHAMSAKDMPVPAHVAVAVRARFGNPTDAAKALGAGEQLRGAPDPRNPGVVRLADRLRADVGDAAYDPACATDVALDRADAIALVRSCA